MAKFSARKGPNFRVALVAAVAILAAVVWHPSQHRKNLPILSLMEGQDLRDVPGNAPQAPTVPALPTAKLTWTYPCAFTYADGSAYETKLTDLECDYMHVLAQNAAEQFNGLPTPAAQQAFLQSLLPMADAAVTTYQSRRDALLKATDPGQISEGLPPQEHLQKLMGLRAELSSATVICRPFLWPSHAETPTYVENTPETWRQTWKPCMQPFWNRAQDLAQRIQYIQPAVVTNFEAAAERSIAQGNAPMPPSAALAGNLAGHASDSQAAADAFDGSAAGVSADALAAARAQPLLPLQGQRRLPDDYRSPLANFKARPQTAPQASPSPANAPAPYYSHLAVEPSQTPPAPNVPPQFPQTQQAESERNYFSRGFGAGMDRLQNDATVAWWHAAGQTHTIGNPLADASLIVHQEGPSCGVGAQYEAMKARGLDVNIQSLAQEGLEKGYYREIRTNNGQWVGGTPVPNTDKLLLDHGINASVVTNATPQQLNDAILKAGSATVSVKTKLFWNDPNIPDGGRHDVYLTGAEQDSNGNIVGYYFNDTGTAEAARFVPAADFLRAWAGNFVSFAGNNP